MDLRQRCPCFAPIFSAPAWACTSNSTPTPRPLSPSTPQGRSPITRNGPSLTCLGLNDRVIAQGLGAAEFYPGHNKWDYEYSLGQLKPDVVADNFDQLPNSCATRRFIELAMAFMSAATRHSWIAEAWGTIIGPQDPSLIPKNFLLL